MIYIYDIVQESKEGSNRKYKACLSIWAIVHLLDRFCELKLGHFGVLYHYLKASVCSSFARHSWAFSGLFQDS
jgi:hypothetical protein